MLHEQGFGANVIRASYPDKNCSFSMLLMTCCRVDETGSAVTRHAGSLGRSLCCCSWWTFWTLFRYWVGSWHTSLKCLNCWRKAVQSLIRYSSIFKAQLHVHLKKWTLKCTHWTISIASIKFAGYVAWILKSVLSLENTEVFLGDCFVIGALCKYLNGTWQTIQVCDTN